MDFSKKIDYDLLVEKALLDVVKNVLTHLSKYGCPNENCIYITFKTRQKGVKLPDYISKDEKYKDEMTIILEKHFENLSVSDKEFGVTLNFGGNPYYITVPFSAITAFVDSIANFSYAFDVPDIYGEDRFDIVDSSIDPKPHIDYDANRKEEEKKKDGKDKDNIISLDDFRD
ncbi:MAG: ClpXP protease specificity-enhancing factor SspB [Alphaproteobacteria bacterium]|nr:ClpXP protease specificity-enhancing factor SspB [Alphaproteobacteria bacterium]